MSLTTSPAALLHSAFDLLWPPWCPGCRLLVSSRGALCPSCELALPWMQGPFCAVCGESMTGDIGVCSRCLEKSPAYRGGRSALRYEGVIRTVLLAWKYDGVRYYEPLIRHWMAQFVAALPEKRYANIDAILPVPLHPRRLQWRGFNQATVLGQAVAYEWGLPLWQGTLLRTRFTPPQQRTSGKSIRERNLEGAFQVPDRELVRGRRLVLIDDVATSGATLQACAVALKGAGAQSVTFLTLARQSLQTGSHVKAPGLAIQGHTREVE